MAKRRSYSRKTRKMRGGSKFTLFERIFSPVKHALDFTGESGKTVGNTAGNIVKKSVGAVNKVGTGLAKHADMAVRNLTKGILTKGGSRKNNSMMKKRGGSRKNNSMMKKRGGSRKKTMRRSRAGTCRGGC